jgi:predicted lipoprotein with Yx(FWY)xxD motif
VNRLIALLLLTPALATAAFGQLVHNSVTYTFNGDSADDLLGWSVSGAGDVNNDGFDDIIVGAIGDDNIGGAGSNSGSARVFSGANGSILYTFNGNSIGDQFGFSVSGAGDVNDDGFDDIIVGANFDDSNGVFSGSARVFSGANGLALYTFNGDSPFEEFGYSVSGAGDVNNDGFDDLIVGAPFDNNNGTLSGSARVFSGMDGSILYTFNGDSAGDRFGFSVSGAGDVNKDGYDDFIVGAPEDDNNGSNSGSARVFSGFDGSVLYTFNGDSAGDILGRSVSGAGDVDGDDFDDLIVSAQGADNNGVASGSARVFSGASGAILYTFNGDSANARLGVSVSGAGDVDNDGFADLIVGGGGGGNIGSISGIARVFSGATGAILYTFNGDAVNDQFGDQFGWSVSCGGDVNGDGFADFIVGAPRDDNNGNNSGSARVFISTVLSPPCSGDTNGDGVVNFNDLVLVLAEFIINPQGADGRGIYGFADLNAVLANYGNTCPE